MDIKLTNIQIEDPLQHNNAKPCKLGERSDPTQKQKVQHKKVGR